MTSFKDSGRHISIFHHRLLFKRPSGTSRGILNHKDSWYMYTESSQGIAGIGEASLIEGLSPDDSSRIADMLVKPVNTHDTVEFPAASFAY